MKFPLKKTRRQLMKAESALVDPDAYRARMKLELRTRRSLKTYNDLVDMNETIMNAVLCPCDEDSGQKPIIDNKQAALMGYLISIQLQAIKAARSEYSPADGLVSALKGEDGELELTDEEVKKLVGATQLNLQINILNTAASRPKNALVHETDALIEAQTQNSALIPASLSTAIRNVTLLQRGIDPDNSPIDAEFEEIKQSDENNDIPTLS